MKAMRALQYALVAVIILTTLAACAAPAAPAPCSDGSDRRPPRPNQPRRLKPPRRPNRRRPRLPPPQGARADQGPRPRCAAALKAPIPYPDPPKIEVGAEPVKRQPISEIVTYKALPEYKEPAWVTELVKAGKLPPVEERLPKEPQVILKSGMADGIGVYGDVGRFFSACPTAGWNYTAGTTSGWFGIESNSNNYDALVQTGPLFRADTDVEPFPQLAKSWEWSADGKQLTMHLMEGAKWSDGEPFTADDVIFTWEDYISDPNVNSWRKADAWTFGGAAGQAREGRRLHHQVDLRRGRSRPQTFYPHGRARLQHHAGAHLQAAAPEVQHGDGLQGVRQRPAPQDLPQVTMGPLGRDRVQDGRACWSCAATRTSGRWTRQASSSRTSTRSSIRRGRAAPAARCA